MFDWLRRLLRRPAAVAPRILFAQDVWDDMIQELGRRGLHGQRESGAFLLTPRDGDGRLVTRVAFLDDLDPDCLVGAIHFRRSGYTKLWALCDAEGVRVLADVHTHPGAGINQSYTDRDNPMVARVGHLALIVPDYATGPVAPPQVSVGEYRGDDGWLRHEPAGVLYVGRAKG